MDHVEFDNEDEIDAVLAGIREYTDLLDTASLAFDHFCEANVLDESFVAEFTIKPIIIRTKCALVSLAIAISRQITANRHQPNLIKVAVANVPVFTKIMSGVGSGTLMDNCCKPFLYVCTNLLKYMKESGKVLDEGLASLEPPDYPMRLDGSHIEGGDIRSRLVAKINIFKQKARSREKRSSTYPMKLYWCNVDDVYPDPAKQPPAYPKKPDESNADDGATCSGTVPKIKTPRKNDPRLEKQPPAYSKTPDESNADDGATCSGTVPKIKTPRKNDPQLEKQPPAYSKKPDRSNAGDGATCSGAVPKIKTPRKNDPQLEKEPPAYSKKPDGSNADEGATCSGAVPKIKKTYPVSLKQPPAYPKKPDGSNADDGATCSGTIPKTPKKNDPKLEKQPPDYPKKPDGSNVDDGATCSGTVPKVKTGKQTDPIIIEQRHSSGDEQIAKKAQLPPWLKQYMDLCNANLSLIRGQQHAGNEASLTLSKVRLYEPSDQIRELLATGDFPFVEVDDRVWSKHSVDLQRVITETSDIAVAFDALAKVTTRFFNDLKDIVNR